MLDRKMLSERVVLFVVLLVLAGSFVYAQSGFEISSTQLKVSLGKDEKVTKSLGVSASDAGEDFILEIVGDLSGVELGEGSFSLSQGERKSVDVLFDSSEIKPGAYVGGVTIVSSEESVFVPLIFEVESEDVFFDANLDIPPIYTEIDRGSKVITQVKVFDLTAGGRTSGGAGGGECRY